MGFYGHAAVIAVFVGWGLMVLVSGLWAMKAWPPDNVCRKYGFWTLVIIKWPWSKSWEKRIERNDIEVFQNFRRRWKRAYTLMILTPFVYIAIYWFLYFVVFDGSMHSVFSALNLWMEQ